MSILIQKFGGTSVADPLRRERCAETVLAAVEKGYQVVVVVSAMGRKGDPYATDTILSLLGEAGATQTPQEQDLAISCGEILSSVIFSTTLRRYGLTVRTLTGGQAGIITNEEHTDAKILRIEPTSIVNHLQTGHVVVVAGFQGVSESGFVTTLGRGGSDTSAVALGAALRAEVVQIFTDVNGMMTADPRVVPEARTLTQINYEESFQLAQQGAKVIHPRAVEIARQYSLPIRIQTPTTELAGTLISYGGETIDRWRYSELESPVVGVTSIAPMTQIRIIDSRSIHKQYELLDLLARQSISIDLINLTPDIMSFIVGTVNASKTTEILRQAGFMPQVKEDVAKVSVVGAAMHGRPGIMATIVGALERQNIEILASADSHLSIACLVDSKHMEAAVRALHAEFGLGR